MENITTDFVLQANNLIGNRKFDEAIELCNSGLELYPIYPLAYCVLAKAYYFAEQHDKAAEVIKQACKHFPYNGAVQHTDAGITNKTLILEATTTNTLPEKPMQDPAPAELITNTEEEPQTETSQPKLVQVAPEDIPEDFSQEIELLDAPPASAKPNIIAEPTDYEITDSDIEEAELIQATDSNIEDELQLEGEENSLDEEFHMVDDEGYFPKYVHQDSIADMLDAEDTTTNADPENATEAITDNMPETEPEEENIEAEATEDADWIEEKTIELETEPDAIDDAPPAFMPTIKQHTDSFVFDAQYDKSPTELLYEADFDLPKTKVEFDYNWYVPQHFNNSLLAESLQQLATLHLNCSIGTYFDKSMADSFMAEPAAEDTTSDSILSLANSLKDAKVSATIEPAAEEEEIEMPLIASETMAKILIKQKKYDKAQQIYELLIEEKPEKAEYFGEQLSNIQQLAKAEVVEL